MGPLEVEKRDSESLQNGEIAVDVYTFIGRTVVIYNPDELSGKCTEGAEKFNYERESLDGVSDTDYDEFVVVDTPKEQVMMYRQEDDLDSCERPNVLYSFNVPPKKGKKNRNLVTYQIEDNKNENRFCFVANNLEGDINTMDKMVPG